MQGCVQDRLVGTEHQCLCQQLGIPVFEATMHAPLSIYLEHPLKNKNKLKESPGVVASSHSLSPPSLPSSSGYIVPCPSPMVLLVPLGSPSWWAGRPRYLDTAQSRRVYRARLSGTASISIVVCYECVHVQVLCWWVICMIWSIIYIIAWRNKWI